MSETQLEFKLVKPAKSKGGDKYQCTTKEDFMIYLPQEISRKNGKTRDSVTITFDLSDE